MARGLSPTRNGVIAALDLGSSKVCCFIARLDAEQRPKIIGIGQQMSHGIKAGTVVDMEAAEDSILAAIHAAEQMAGETIDRVLVNLSGGHPASHSVGVEVSIAGQKVGDADLRQALDQGYEAEAMGAANRHLVHTIPTDFSIDGCRGVREPRGLSGDRLGLTLHFVTAASGAVRNLVNCVQRCHLEVVDLVVSPYASGLAALVEDEMELGATVIDLGGGTTSIAIFFEGRLIHAEALPVGGQHVTTDIARGLAASVAHAERLKALYGHATAASGDERETIEVPQVGEEGDGQPRQIPRAHLVDIVRPRVEETLEMVRDRLDASGLNGLAGRRVVLTGGASQLAGIRELAATMLDKQVRIGRPAQIEGLAEATAGPAYATCAGLLLYGALAESAPSRRLPLPTAHPSHFLGRIGSWLREHF